MAQPTTFEQLQRALRGKALQPIPKPAPSWTLNPVEVAAQEFQAGNAPIRTELYGNGAGAIDIASRRPFLPDLGMMPTAPVNIGPSSRPNMPPPAQEIVPGLVSPGGAPSIPGVVAPGAGVSPGEINPGEIGEYVPLPPPTRRQIPIQSYDYPNAPQAPTYQAAPQRNTDAERKSLQRGTLLSGLVGLLAGGAPGALAAANSYQGAGQKSFDNQYGKITDAVGKSNDVLANTYKGQLGQYDAQLDAIRMRQAGDDKDAALIERQNTDEERFYNQGEANRIKVYNAKVADRAKGEVRKILQQRANTGDVVAATNLMGMESLINDRTQKAIQAGEVLDHKKLMDELGYDLKKKQFDWLMQHQGVLGEVAKQNADANTTRALNQSAHNSWLEQNGNLRTGFERDRVEIARMKGAGGGAKPTLTEPQRQDILEKLARADLDIAKIRSGAGKKPDVTKEPEAYGLWEARSEAAEKSAKALRDLRTEQAAMVGYRLENGTYKPFKTTGAPRTAADPGYDATMRDTVKPYSIPIPPNSSGRRELTGTVPPPSRRLTQNPVINPAAQSGNRAAMSKSAIPAPRQSPVLKPKRDFKSMSDAELKKIMVGGK